MLTTDYINRRKIFRKIIFVRHGQYSLHPEKLTKLGRKQAKLTAKAISYLQPSKIHSSTMPRALETAGIIAQRTKIKVKSHNMFREGLLPGTVEFSSSISKKLNQTKGNLKTKARTAKKTADLAFKTLFSIPKRGQYSEVVVAHGNVIRYWVCKALDISEDKWLNMEVSHCSITTIRISNSGNIVLLGFSDVGHLPLKSRSSI